MTPDKYRQQAEEIAGGFRRGFTDDNHIADDIQAALLAAYADGAREMRERASQYVEWLTSEDRDGSEPDVALIDEAFNNAGSRASINERSARQGKAISAAIAALPVTEKADG